jgi:Fic family protein
LTLTESQLLFIRTTICFVLSDTGELAVIFQVPALDDMDRAVLACINSQRDQLRTYTQSNPRRWMGSLRRNTLARAIRGSNSIEGIHASIENVLAAIQNEEPADTDIERTTWLEIRGYRDAMTYIIQAAQDRYFEFSKQFMKSLQFMMVGHDMEARPGQWRPGPIYVVNQPTGKTVYEGPDAALVNGLVQELVDYLQAATPEPPMIRAAMAHLNLTMIHPFKDGNGRLSRALQTLVLARDGIVHPVFSSIEEWLGRNTQEYYAVLAEVGQGAWHPENDARPWIRFCLKAHHHQAATLLRRNAEYEMLYSRIEGLVTKEEMPERSTIVLFDAATGLSVTNSWYRSDIEVSEVVASRDLRKLCEAGLLVPHGEKRGRTYQASEKLLKIRRNVRKELGADEPYVDPYELMADKHNRDIYLTEPRLPGV